MAVAEKAVRIALQIAPPLTQAENIEQIRRSLRSLFARARALASLSCHRGSPEDQSSGSA
jgi:hypothetical protein